jgi:hypothetical protein
LTRLKNSCAKKSRNCPLTHICTPTSLNRYSWASWPNSGCGL